MINILEILKKIPNLEDMVFYSPLYGDVKIKLDDSNIYFPIGIFPLGRIQGTTLSKFGYFDETNFCGERELMLYPSRQNKDWLTFKVPRKDLPDGTSVMVSETKEIWELRKYDRNHYCYDNCCIGERTWKYIISVDKFNFDDWTFKEEDNYGTTYKE